ncbi:hypothetical protein [Noviherbaspirillum aerium]|uniref:hypothetical protein n=1 Tax=Noviherbaspirillum aerium TaxID=2588497 RepID=UPI00178C761E|nr:hypothetical protein [Noviherbaspirillum aerium]
MELSAAQRQQIEDLLPWMTAAVLIGPMVYQRVTLRSRVEKKNMEARKKAGYS